jgi:hypothetical protein
MNGFDALLLVAALLCAAALFCAQWFVKTPEALRADVYVGGALVAALPLERDAEYAAAGVEVEVSGGGVRVARANCRDQLCVRRGCVRRAGESIVCLPNRVSVVLAGGDALDGVLY